MAAFRGPIIGFGCSEQHRTYANTRSTGRFALSFPPAEQADAGLAPAFVHEPGVVGELGVSRTPE